ncbi:NAD(P)H-dependent FMN reductase [Murinocardiopsis flavida]|uniref:NAD(P)H-dependent FMN reductase n=1 Tax=Murinocardiopsis flavida TaxID=645275 RepID=A0A2P8DSC0_9ACTN|nr:NAD(P)H-dependent FMN reductase [Murinocardiopsis flavida]
MCGSLRSGSYNAALIDAAARGAPDLDFSPTGLAGRLPLFDPDIEQDEAAIPAPAAEFRRHAVAAEAVVISGPEYARGPSGAAKNALDWLVGCGGLTDRPTLLMSASPGPAGGLNAQQPIMTTLAFLGAVLVSTVSVPRVAARYDTATGLFESDVRLRVDAAVAELRSAIAYARGRPRTQLIDR